MVGAYTQAEEAYKDYGVVMKNLFNVIQPVHKHDAQIVQIRGINLTDNYPDGSLEWSTHVSLERYPYLTAWTQPEIIVPSAIDPLINPENIDALTSWSTSMGNIIFFHDGTMFIREADSGHRIADNFLPGPKQFAVLQNKLVIWPDKVYVNLLTYDVVPLAQHLEPEYCTFAAHSVTLHGATEYSRHLEDRFNVDDMVRISEITGVMAANNGWWRVSAVEDDTIYFSMPEEQAFVTGDTDQGGSHRVYIERVIPNLDYITVQNNRLWGVDNEEQTIWSSVQGDPTNFYTYKGVASDAGAIPVSSSGDFTGITTLGPQVLAFKEDRLYKVLGSYPEEYRTYEYQHEGVANGCHKSMVIINEALYYMSPHGVMVYQGQQPVPISTVLGPDGFEGAVAGTDGLRYYTTFKTGEDVMGDVYSLFSYDTRLGIWIQEDLDVQAYDFARIGSDCYMLTDAGVSKLRAGDKDDGEITWHVEFKKFYEASTGSDNKYMVAPVLKRYHRLIFRVDLPVGSSIAVNISYDDEEPFQTIATISGKKGIASYPVPIAKCDSFRLRLDGAGPGTVLQIVREFSLGTTR